MKKSFANQRTTLREHPPSASSMSLDGSGSPSAMYAPSFFRFKPMFRSSPDCRFAHARGFAIELIPPRMARRTQMEMAGFLSVKSVVKNLPQKTLRIDSRRVAKRAEEGKRKSGR
jgi:hypothetical protein